MFPTLFPRAYLSTNMVQTIERDKTFILDNQKETLGLIQNFAITYSAALFIYYTVWRNTYMHGYDRYLKIIICMNT